MNVPASARDLVAHRSTTDPCRCMMARVRVAVIGAGPRGLSVVERICANARARAEQIELYLIDPFEPGAGAVWRTTQSTHLLMNTVASQITVFTDDSVTIDGPVEPGDSLYERHRRRTASGSLPGEQFTASLGPDDYPTRAIYGCYLVDALQHVIQHAPPNVSIRIFSDTVVSFEESPSPDRTWVIELKNGRPVPDLDSIVLALGHSDSELSGEPANLSREAKAHGFRFHPPANPADVDLAAIAPQEAVIVRGLGLTFFDYVALLTTGRGGVFTEIADGLQYVASGREPRLFVGSRRGLPHHARGRNEKGAQGCYSPRVLTPIRIEQLRQQHHSTPLHFRRDIWPLISREVECAYYERLIADSNVREAFVDCYLGAAPEQLDSVLTSHGFPADKRWNWDLVERPWEQASFTDADSFNRWLREYLTEDVIHAEKGNVSGPVKAALDVLRDLRNEIRLIVDHNGIDGHSYRAELEAWYTPLNAFLSIGPPVQRIRELVALMDAGLVSFVGPNMQVTIDADGFRAESNILSDSTVHARTLIEARLTDPDVRTSSNVLVRSMLNAGQCSPYQLVSENGLIETGGMAVTRRPYRVISDRWPGGAPGIFAYGIPTETVHWVTAAGSRPGVNSVTLRDADAIARAILQTDEAENVRPNRVEQTA